MSRRVNLPGADELFRSTTPTAVSPDSGTGSAAEREQSAARVASGRVKHDEKMTVYLTSEELLALEQARLTLKSMLGRKVDRGRIVRAALERALEDLETNGVDSDVFGWLSD